jgi:hypothetical protein
MTLDEVPFEVRDGDYVVSTDPARIDIGYVHAFLANSYWSPGIPRDVVARAIGLAILRPARRY